MSTIRTALTAVLLTGALTFMAPTEALAQTKSRDLITREEIENSAQRDQDIFAVIRGLRPHFLAPPRGIRTLGNSVRPSTALYVDGVREDANVLRTIMASSVIDVRYLDPSRSEGEYGPTAAGGAVVVRRSKTSDAPAQDTVKTPPD